MAYTYYEVTYGIVLSAAAARSDPALQTLFDILRNLDHPDIRFHGSHENGGGVISVGCRLSDIVDDVHIVSAVRMLPSLGEVTKVQQAISRVFAALSEKEAVIFKTLSENIYLISTAA